MNFIVRFHHILLLRWSRQVLAPNSFVFFIFETEDSQKVSEAIEKQFVECMEHRSSGGYKSRHMGIGFKEEDAPDKAKEGDDEQPTTGAEDKPTDDRGGGSESKDDEDKSENGKRSTEDKESESSRTEDAAATGTHVNKTKLIDFTKSSHS